MMRAALLLVALIACAAATPIPAYYKNIDPNAKGAQLLSVLNFFFFFSI